MPQPKYDESAAARQAAYHKRCAGVRRAELAARGLPSLPAIPTMPGWPRWSASKEAAHHLIERTVAEMQGYFDDLSEEWQDRERGQEHQDKIDLMQGLLDAFTDLTL